MEYKVFIPTQEMLDNLEKGYLYYNGLDLHQDIHRHKMLLVYLSHQPMPKERADFNLHYNAFLYELEVLYDLIKTREYRWFKECIKDYLKGKDFEYGVDLPYNDYMDKETDVEEEKLSVKGFLFEQVLIQALRGDIDYNEEQEDWYERFNSFVENIDYAIDKYVQLIHYELCITYKDYLDTEDGEE
jgi:hypothetical protein